MSDTQIEVLHRTLFSTRQSLDENIMARRATEKVLDERLSELGRCQVQLSIAQERILNLQTEYNNVVEKSESKAKDMEETFRTSEAKLKEEIVILNDKISELRALCRDMPETPAEQLLENVLHKTMAHLHSTVVYFAALTLNSNPQSLAGKELLALTKKQTLNPGKLFSLSVKEKQIVLENIRSFVQAELDNSEYTNIRAVITAMTASDKSWKTFRDGLKNSKVLSSLASDKLEFDSAVNAVVEFILEQLK